MIIVASLVMFQAVVQANLGARKDHPFHAKASAASPVRQFVQQFYNWYTPKVLHSLEAKNPADTNLTALRSRPSVFSPALRKALLEDRLAQRDAGHDIVGIDFDPFLGGQDPARHYWAGSVAQHGSAWLVGVWSAYGRQSHQPDVVAVVERRQDKRGWQFANFVYDKADNLLDTLHTLKKQRDDYDKGTKPIRCKVP